jgi:hypothetical protein
VSGSVSPRSKERVVAMERACHDMVWWVGLSGEERGGGGRVTGLA